MHSSGPALALVFAKLPRAGAVKTRLLPVLSPEEAARLAVAMLADGVDLARRAATCFGHGSGAAVSFAPPDAAEDMRVLVPAGVALWPQSPGDLGERLRDAAVRAGSDGYAVVLCLGADAPTLPIAYLLDAVAAVRSGSVDVALGPAEDGGYCFVALRPEAHAVFDRIPWSTPAVLAATLARAAALGLRTVCSPLWYDVDDAPALRRLVAHLETLPEETAPQTRAMLATVGAAT